MKNFFKGKFATALVVIATVILAGVAIFTALRLYQLGQQPVAPNAPAKPKAAEPVSCSLLTFTISENSPTITPTNVPGATLTLTLTPTEPPVGGISETPTPTTAPTETSAPSVTPTLPPPPSIPEPPNCDSQKPEAPTLTSVTRSGTEATLTWTSVSLATHYVISYGTSPTNLQYGVPNTGNVTTYTISSLNANSKYYFTVYAVNNCMPSDGSKIVTSVAGSSTETSELPNAGITLPTILSLGAGVIFITLAILLAI